MPITLDGTNGITTPAVTSTGTSGVLVRAASTQDGVEIIGRAGGTSSYKITLTPTTLSSSTTLTLPNTTGTVALLGAQTFTGTQTFSGTISSTGNAYQEIDTLTDAATITPDFGVGNNFTVTLGGNRTLANPTNLTAGQSGVIFVVQDATGGRTLSYGTSWDFPNAVAPTLTTTANAIDVIVYTVRSGTSIAAQLITNIG